mmetsp:Transcript_45536/g.138400  ORF Transcript_45536/g.138400 Transcript_45536/m.138400 type:complete len:101 (-) Transcript_45536:420-722(-)
MLLFQQQLSKKDILGRVLALEFACAMGFESLSACLAGRFKDAGYGDTQVAQAAAAIGGTLFLAWSIYHLFGGGAAHQYFNRRHDKASGTNTEVLHDAFIA